MIFLCPAVNKDLSLLAYLPYKEEPEFEKPGPESHFCSTYI